MPKAETCWGIDIGNASLKALRLRPGESPSVVVAEAFDYIEYPMLLTQPSADPTSLVETALRQFLSRNEVRGHKVAISVSGATGLARFIKLPPVELSKLPDVVGYEAKQQIPYDLNSVVWRYQRLDAGGSESGFTLGSTIGLFALRRDQVQAALQPFVNVGIEVDVIQLSPLAIFNYVRFDAMPDLPPPDEYDPDNPPPSVVVISMGTDSTDLVITNGFRIWQRNVPLGGNHFTKALSKELKLTFSKAEHVKKNPSTHSDPKAVFQAMRPVFSELLAEIQRSISYYNTIDRSVEISRGLALGNAMKLQGLRAYLEKGLGFPLELVEKYERMMGPDVVQSPVFRENLSCFGIVYGLGLQGIGRAYMEINMLPDEIAKDRFIRAKKPWALAAATTLLLGCTVSFAAQSMALSRVSPERYGDAERTAEQVLKTAKQYESELSSVISEFQKIETIGKNLTSSVQGRLLWLELLAAVNQSLPQYQFRNANTETVDASAAGDSEAQQKILEQRDEIHITSLEATQTEQLETWWQRMGGWYRKPGAADTEPEPTPATTGAAPSSATGATGTSPYGAGSPYDMSSTYGSEGGGYPGYGMGGGGGMSGPPAPNPPPEDVTGPTGPGYIIRLTGYHFHNSDVAGPNQGAQYVRNTLIRHLEEGKFWINGQWLTAKELGIGYPILINPGRVEVVQMPDPYYVPPTGTAAGALGTAQGMNRMATATGMPPGMTGSLPPGTAPGTTTGGKIPGIITLRRFSFVVEFAWQPKTESEREELRKAAAQAAAEAAAAEGADSEPETGEQQQPAAETQGGPSSVPGAPAGPGNVPPGTPAPAGAAAPGVQPGGVAPQGSAAGPGTQPGGAAMTTGGPQPTTAGQPIVPQVPGGQALPPGGAPLPGGMPAVPPAAEQPPGPLQAPVNPADLPDAPILPPDTAPAPQGNADQAPEAGVNPPSPANPANGQNPLPGANPGGGPIPPAAANPAAGAAPTAGPNPGAGPAAPGP